MVVMERRAFRIMFGVGDLIVTIAASLLMSLRRAEIEVRSGGTNSQAQKQGNQEERVHETKHLRESRTLPRIPQGKDHVAGASPGLRSLSEVGLLQSVSGASTAPSPNSLLSNRSSLLSRSSTKPINFMKSLIAATLLVASIGFAAPPDSPSPKAPSSPSKPNPVMPLNKLPDEAADGLKSGVKFILFSLEPPMTRAEANENLKPEQKHHGFKILGSTELVNAETKNSAITTLMDAVKNSNGGSAMCFSPRHSLRAVT